MKLIFSRGPSYLLRLIVIIVISLILLVAESRYNLFASSRLYLNSLVSPIQYVADIPQSFVSSFSKLVVTREELKVRNLRLEKENTLLTADRLLLSQLQLENKKIRKLLNSHRDFTSKRMLAEVMSLRSDPFRYQLLINKGALDGVYLGQPVINDVGVVGQISEVGSLTSRVLLLVDASHGIPVRVQRNDLVAVVHGSGSWNKLDVPFIPSNADLKEGDLLVTSGLGGRFPEGYPVATISHFKYTKGAAYADVEATPVTKLGQSHYLLLLWHNSDKDQAKRDKTTLEKEAIKENAPL
ncbi:rod shape-determining protein MreC [Psychromonas sp. CNPT3]|uniref:rod shape-determining protein MreC n=1 Tax=Psychromonas sp. CNPT3 TaxID=314282 RepID=UPI0002C0925C|nr:rod shape-determining protein MreC [Psychromonas sp. CNPT3]AGH80615.1 rod shape-determining protein MreC [Psychromonas sp. CNPT3]